MRKRKTRVYAAGDRTPPAARQESPMVLVRSTWTDAGGGSQQDFRLVALSTDDNEERVLQATLARLRAQGRKDCAVELFDPNNVPPGTIPDDARVTFGELSSNREEI